jgi:alkanesulfonate monooxygenase SsuD/methylene tetrahydromethanopterin reductase-like flavin-dependent oxidoreductase (luciferase family)
VEYVVMPRPWDAKSHPGKWAAEREAEGWHGLGVGDHWYLEGSGGCLNPFVVLGNAAAHTTNLRLTTTFANNLFRSPVELAQAALSIHFVSDGRFELGVGAGWCADELERAGLQFPEPAVRVRRFRECVEIVRALLSGPCTYDGEFYNVDLPAVGIHTLDPPLLSAALGGPVAMKTIGPLVDRIELATMGPAFRNGHNNLDAFKQFGATTRADLQRLIDLARTAHPAAPIGLSLYVAAGTTKVTQFFASVFEGGCYQGLAGEPRHVADTIESFTQLDIDRITVMPPGPGTAEALAPHLLPSP